MKESVIDRLKRIANLHKDKRWPEIQIILKEGYDPIELVHLWRSVCTTAGIDPEEGDLGRNSREVKALLNKV